MSNPPPVPPPDPRYAQLVRQYGERARVPVNTSVLEYAHAEPRRFPVALQFILGLIAPLAYGALAVMTLAMVERVPEVFTVLALVHPLVFIGLVIWLRVAFKLRGFLAGVLTMVLGLPLGFGAVCAVICANL